MSEAEACNEIPILELVSAADVIDHSLAAELELASEAGKDDKVRRFNRAEVSHFARPRSPVLTCSVCKRFHTIANGKTGVLSVRF